MITAQEILLIAVILMALLLILSNRLRADLVAILVMVLLPILGVVSFQEAFSGFSRSVVLTIIGLFVITQALEDTGVVQWIAKWLNHLGKSSEVRLIILFMAMGAILSLVMNNIAAGAVLLPAAVQVARDSRVAPSKILIPLSFGTLVGGMATYFTTANIILSSILRDQGQPALNMLDFLPTGGLITISALAFMALVGRKLLPTHESSIQSISPNFLSQNLYQTYQLEDRLWEVHVLANSPLVNKTLEQSQIGSQLGLSVVAIWRNHQAILNPRVMEIIREGDYLLVLGREERVEQLRAFHVEIGRRSETERHARPFSVNLTEVIIPPRSTMIGKSLTEIGFRKRFDLTAVALWREGRSYRTDVGKMPLEVGDGLLMVGEPGNIAMLAREPDFLVLHNGHQQPAPLRHKAGWAVGITILVILASIFEIIPTAEAMLIGMAAMALTGCISLDEAYRAIEWRVVFLIAGMLPLSIAMVNTGLAGRVGEALVQSVSPIGPLALIASLFLLTMLVTQVIGGQVASLIVGPIAITSALQIGISAQAVAVAVAIACSTAFLTPIAHPVNILMMSPGGYKPKDFLRVGSFVTVIVFIFLLVGMIVFWGIPLR